MKALVIGSVYPRFPEDAEVPWLRTSIAHLKKAGVEIQVLAPSYKGLKSHDIDGTHVNRFRYAPANWEILTHEEGAPSKMASKPWLQLLAIPYIINGFIQCLRICRKWKPDVIHAHWPFPHAYIVLGAAKLFKIPLVLNFHGAELLLIRKKKWVKPLLKFAIGQAQAIFANSSFTASKIKAIRNVNVEWSPYGTTLETKDERRQLNKASVATNVVGHDQADQLGLERSDNPKTKEGESLPLASAANAASATPSSGGTPQRPEPHPVNNKFKILFVGRHIERKGICYLIEAAKYLPKDKFEIRIVGVGDLTEQLKKQAEAVGSESSVQSKAIESMKSRISIQRPLSSQANFLLKILRTNTARQTSLYSLPSSIAKAIPKASASCSSKPWNSDFPSWQATSAESRMSSSTENLEFSFPKKIPLPSQTHSNASPAIHRS